MNLPGIFINRPVATILLTIGLLLTGIVGYRMLPVSPLPNVDFPTILVYASLPGADPETMATSVAAPLERSLGTIAGITEITSTSQRGSTRIILQFDLSRDIDGAARDVQAALNAAQSRLPSNLPRNPGYRKINPADAPILIISLTSRTVKRSVMYDTASTVLQQKIAQIGGIGQVTTGGGALPAVRVELNPTALFAYGIAIQDVQGALRETNAASPKGQLEDAQTSWLIETNDQLRVAADYQDILVAYREGRPVFLKDVALVEDSVEDVRNLGLMNSQPAVLLIVFRRPGANIIETVDAVRAALPQLAAVLPEGVDMNIVMDRSPPIRASLLEVERTLVIACLLVVLVVFCFLRRARITLIPGVAVVTSLVGTFGVMYLLGFSLNNLSLTALTIATGFVVDDAVVVLENIASRTERGATPMQAALDGAKEISFTVISMSLSLVAVFIPILLMSGMVGRLFREFAVTLSVAVAISLLVSLTATPMMCARLLGRQEKRHEPGRTASAAARLFARPVAHLDAFCARLYAGYGNSLHLALRRRHAMLGLTAGILALNIWLYAVAPKGVFPQQDTGRLIASLIADQSTSFQAMALRLTEVVEKVRNDPDVEHVVGFTGGGAGNSASMYISLTAPPKRTASAEQVMGRLRGALSDIPGTRAYMQVVQELRVGGRSSGASYQYTLQGESFQDVNLWMPRVQDAVRALPQLADVNSDQQNKGLQARIVLDRDAASRLGISASNLDNALYGAFGQSQVSVNYTALNQYHVVMEVAPEYRQGPEALRDIHVRTDTGRMVPLAAIARIEHDSTSLSVNHQGQFPSVTLSFNLKEGAALGEAVEAVQAEVHKLGLPQNIQAGFRGMAQFFQNSLTNQLLLILAALAAVYIVLGMLYESAIHPLTILSTLPSAGVGAVLALLVTGTDLNLLAVIGILLLIGIVKKNGILIVDFALEAERRDGLEPEQAIHAACLKRFRPIMMTTAAALLGALPLALSTGSGWELRRPLGISIIGGLLFSQMLTLYTTPAIYLSLDKLRRRRRQAKAPADGDER